jgi:hypothetical protein
MVTGGKVKRIFVIVGLIFLIALSAIGVPSVMAQGTVPPAFLSLNQLFKMSFAALGALIYTAGSAITGAMQCRL